MNAEEKPRGSASSSTIAREDIAVAGVTHCDWPISPRPEVADPLRTSIRSDFIAPAVEPPVGFEPTTC